VKVALGHVVREGPWGGGNRFAAALAEMLRRRGDAVVASLADDDIDVILMVDPRARNPAVPFTPGDIFRYLLRHGRRVVVVHRINECDERKGGGTMNARLRLANYVADHTVFIANWLKDLSVWRAGDGRSWSVIRNGGDPALFDGRGHVPWNGREPLRLVTHHWGAHPKKGFDVYSQLDDLLTAEPWRGRIEFTYIGNIPSGFTFRHARQLAPLDGPALAAELAYHHVYLTASINEPAGMHHIEGALSGLPLLYRISGGLHEYCQGFGVGFSGPADFPPALSTMMAEYGRWRMALADYPWTVARMCAEYLALFDDLVARRETIVTARRLWRAPLTALFVQVPW
jgi:hypothetical protein